MSLRPRRALVGLIGAVAALAAVPAVASATITPTLTLNQAAGTTAGSSPATGFDAKFAPSAGDSVKDVTFILPPGLLANANLAGGACLTSATPNASCVLGTGSLNAGAVPVTLYLVKGPATTDFGGVAIVNGTGAVVATGDVIPRLTPTLGINVAFSKLSPALGISEMNFSLVNLRLPTSCPTPAADVTMTADSNNDPTVQSAPPAPLTVTGCSSLPYAPKLTAAIATKGGGAALTLGLTQAATESANKSIVLRLPSGISPDVGVVLPCLAGSACTIGTAAATSPLVPNVALAHGTLTLSGTATTPTITIAFPLPFALTLPGTVSLTTGAVTFSNVPDLPLTSLTLNITGPHGQEAFITTCAPSNIVGNFTAQGGQSEKVSVPIAYTGCAPSTSGSASGLAVGKPELKFRATKRKGGPNISTVSVGLPRGLKFSRSAFTTNTTCTTLKGKKHCTSTTVIKGLSVSGGSAKTVALKRGKLVITLTKAVGRVTITTSGPLVTETKSLQTKVKKRKIKKLKFTLKITDVSHHSTTSTVALKTR